jgi:hypothetical protein
MSPEEAWDRSHRVLEQDLERYRQGDTSTPNDNKAVVSSWAMEWIFKWAWREASFVFGGELARVQEELDGIRGELLK